MENCMWPERMVFYRRSRLEQSSSVRYILGGRPREFPGRPATAVSVHAEEETCHTLRAPSRRYPTDLWHFRSARSLTMLRHPI